MLFLFKVIQRFITGMGWKLIFGNLEIYFMEGRTMKLEGFFPFRLHLIRVLSGEGEIVYRKT